MFCFSSWMANIQALRDMGVEGSTSITNKLDLKLKKIRRNNIYVAIFSGMYLNNYNTDAFSVFILF
ncbi:hypothetical protein M6B38_380010 [Iris pallida]|uniref:Uncharacterized protein n=1 Tax=Iris pallida TaxID=29817 RepID=A0AAX6G9E1_IRIPA|nr:hypothetical protein M6B38_133715 [Iris pallida]KAJ6824905.1 hypothetical protein M6B38_380010 [Iris pallida]